MAAVATQSLADHQLFLPALATFLVLLLTSLLLLLYRKFRVKANTILFVGLRGTGKTTMFTRLINPGNRWTYFMSLKENCYTNYATDSGKLFNLVDYPGAESFKKTLYQKWLNQDRKLLKCVIFIVDSATFNKKDVAEFLYDVLYELKQKVPVLVACNKQDIGHAKSGTLIQKSLEQEFGLINISREAALSSTSGEAEKRLLTNTGKSFEWSDLKRAKLEFAECSAHQLQQEEGTGGGGEQYSLSPIREWIEAL